MKGIKNMEKFSRMIETKLIPVSNKISQNKVIKCMSGGSMSLMAIILIGGIFLALIVAIIVTKINVTIVNKNITIKMPEGVPSSVSNSFTALIPGAVICLVFCAVSTIFKQTGYGAANDMIYGLLQKPISSLTGSLPAFLIAVIFSQILWFFGVHGSYTILPIFMPIWFTCLII